MEWILYEQGDIMRAETVYPIPEEEYLFMHIFISATDETNMDEMMAMARSLKNIQ